MKFIILAKYTKQGTDGWLDNPDEDRKAMGFALPEVEDEEPDAVTEVPRVAGKDGPVVAVPELTHPGESASNGLDERSVGVVEVK